MMEYMILIPLKKGYDTDLQKELKNSILSAYGGQMLSDQTRDAIKNFNSMRENVISKMVDAKQESCVEICQKYYDQLVRVHQKVPSAKIWFKWKDAFEKGSLFSSGAISADNIGFEKVCILFNIAAMMSHVGGYQAKEMAFNDESLKKGIKNFQTAAGIFESLKHTSRTLAGNADNMFDVSPECLQVLEYIMLGQAQEAFFFKAIQDGKSEKIIARIGAQCQQYYNELLTQMRQIFLQNKHTIPEWEEVFVVKQLCYTAATEYYMALAADKEKNFGEAICRFEKAIELFKNIESKDLLVTIPDKFKSMSQNSATKLASLKYDNDHIYHERIPEHRTLNPALPASIAKSVALEETFFKGQTDLFDHLLPSGIYQSVSKLEGERHQLIQKEILAMREGTTMLNAILASLNLPAAIEDVKGVEVPKSLLEKSNTVKKMGGVSKLDELLNDLPGALERNKEIINEIEKNLKEEQEQDNKLRTQFKEKWTRRPSNALNGAWFEHITKYRGIINNAVDADTAVRGKYSSNLEKMKLLSAASDSALAQAIPVAQGSASGNESSRETLRELLQQVEQVKAERERLEKRIDTEAAMDSLRGKFVEAMSLHKDVNESSMIADTLGSAFADVQKEIRDNLKKQENLVQMIQEANNAFISAKGSGTNKRDDFLKELAQAYDVFRELHANLKEGAKFYSDLTQVLVNFQEKVTNFCFARKTEMEEQLKNLQSNIASEANEPIPATPSYHQNNQNPPPRPPPPAGAPAQQQNPPPVPYPTQYPTNTGSGYYYPPPLPTGFNPYGAAPGAYYPGQYQYPPQGYPGYNPYQQPPPQ